MKLLISSIILTSLIGKKLQPFNQTVRKVKLGIIKHFTVESSTVNVLIDIT